VPTGAQGLASHTKFGKLREPTKAHTKPRVSSKYFKVPSQEESVRLTNAEAAELTKAWALVPKTVAPAMAATRAGPI